MEVETAQGVLMRCFREAVLRGLLPCISEATLVLQHSSALAVVCTRLLHTSRSPALLVSHSGAGETAYAGGSIVPIAVPPLSAHQRLAGWREAACSRNIAVDEPTLLALAETAVLPGAAIAEVAAARGGRCVVGGEASDGQHCSARLVVSCASAVPR